MKGNVRTIVTVWAEMKTRLCIMLLFWLITSTAGLLPASQSDSPSETAPERSASGETQFRGGDWTIDGEVSVRDEHIVLDGNLILKRDAVLTLDGCTLEIVAESSREHLVDWQGGRLVTRDTVIGGSNRGGAPIHTVFHLYDGQWDAVDTTVQYAYGVSFHAQTRGVLRGERFRAGPRPDAVIASGKADISLTDSTFPIALGIYTNAGGSAVLDLPVAEPVDRLFDVSNVPGAPYRLELVRHTVPNHWFVFLRQISMNAPPCEVVLRDCPSVLVSLLGWNLHGELTLPKGLAAPVRLANVTLRKADRPVGVSSWCIYCGGEESDLVIRGPATIAEFMHRGGRIRLLGTPGTRDLVLLCTTLEMSGSARLELENVQLGRPASWRGKAFGEAKVAGQAKLLGSLVDVGRVVFHTREDGRVELHGVRELEAPVARPDGGPIRLLPD